jgi:para-nitrobenzyl esterase
MRKTIIFISVAALMAACCSNPYDKGPSIIVNSTDAVVQTQYGAVSGYIEDGIYTFKGIPYAKAERFMAPEEPDSWEGVRSCLYYGPQSPQDVRTGWQSDKQAFMFHWDDGTQSEDCQVLNVWTKGINDGKKRPVMVWLHGGGYSMGAGSELPFYDGANLAKKDVVLVNLNHRLNVVGYLDLSAFGEKYKYSGVAGVMDMIMALKWVKENISNFGGDPDNVMIFGQSGGGGKVNILLAAPSAKGLFNKAAVQSGAIMTVTEPEASRQIGIETAKVLGLDEKTIDKIQDVPYTELLEASKKATANLRAAGVNVGMMGVGPVRDGEVLPSQLGAPEVEAISGDVPVIVGHNYSEATSRAGATAELDVRYAWKGAPEYLYIFAKNSPILDGALKSMHNMEISFVFNNIYLGRHMTGTEKEAYALADKMSDVWVSFAKDGNPSIKKLSWEPYNPETKPTMIFDVETKLVYDDDPIIKAMAEQEPFRWNF